MPLLIDTKLVSDFESLDQVGHIVEELTQTADLDEEAQDALMLGLSEAVANAIMHGNKQDPNKWIHLRAERVEGNLEVTVEDEGDGFDPDQVPSPLTTDNRMRQGGRGVFLMRTYCKDVRYSNGGRALTLVV
jgi:serine/threonine-protein kinase RsbW